jgi:Flp pilus assembly pilin Flp
MLVGNIVVGVQHRRGAQRGQGFAEYAFILTLIAMVVMSVMGMVGKHTHQALAPLPVALTPGSTYSSSAKYWIPPATTSSGNFLPQGEFPNGLWEATPGSCGGSSQEVLAATMQPYADNGYSAMALSGSYGNACERTSINLPASVTAGGTFTVTLDIKTEGPLVPSSAWPWPAIYSSSFGFFPCVWSPQLNSVSSWTTFVGTVTMPAAYVAAWPVQMLLTSGETNGGPPAVNAYANIQMFT